MEDEQSKVLSGIRYCSLYSEKILVRDTQGRKGLSLLAI